MFDPRYLARLELYLIRLGGRWNVALHQGEIASVSCANNSETVSRSQTSPYASAARASPVDLLAAATSTSTSSAPFLSIVDTSQKRFIPRTRIRSRISISDVIPMYNVMSCRITYFLALSRYASFVSQVDDVFEKPPKIDIAIPDWNSQYSKTQLTSTS